MITMSVLQGKAMTDKSVKQSAYFVQKICCSKLW